jgi:hypothetical protein
MFTKSVRMSALLALFAGSALSSSASAQSIDSSATQAPVVVSAPAADNAVVTPATGARIAPSGATNRLKAAPVSLQSNAMSTGENVGRDKAMMGAGLAAVVVGLIIGSDVGTLFVVGGALVGLIGLFHYMQ